jgi:hypothetical protein
MGKLRARKRIGWKPMPATALFASVESLLIAGLAADPQTYRRNFAISRQNTENM